MIKAVVWISESTWETCIDEARRLLPDDARVTLVHVAPGDAEDLARGPGGLLGRHPPPPPGPPVRTIAAEEAAALLAAARERLGRAADLSARRGEPEREVLDACAGADVLVLARDGTHPAGPKSIGPRARFVLDHASCHVLLVSTEEG